MKNALLLSLLALLSTQARAESLKDIFQSIADATETGNGNGHVVSKLRAAPDRQQIRQEVVAMQKEMNSQHSDCRYQVHADIGAGIREIRDQWSSTQTASRLDGLDAKGLLKEIVYSKWDGKSGDGEYCSLATIKVFAVDGTVLTFNFDETD